MGNVYEQLELCGIVPVLTIDDARNAEPLAKALVDGGLSSVEVTFRTEAAQDAMKRIAKSGIPMLVGAGTIQSVDQVKGAVDNGATFIVSPGLNRKVVGYCVENKIPVIPGIATPTEIEDACDYGLKVLKFFPAEANGGVAYLQAISAPYQKVKFIPTGGIDESNLLSYLKLPGVLACGGSWMVKKELIAAGKFEEIRLLSANAVRTMLGLKLQHVGIHGGDADKAQKAAAVLADLLRFESNDTSGSIFLGGQFEILKSKGLGEHGHIALGTHSVPRAVEYFLRKGIKTRPETRNEKNGKIATIYLDLEIEGFAVHLIQL